MMFQLSLVFLALCAAITLAGCGILWYNVHGDDDSSTLSAREDTANVFMYVYALTGAALAAFGSKLEQKALTSIGLFISTSVVFNVHTEGEYGTGWLPANTLRIAVQNEDKVYLNVRTSDSENEELLAGIILALTGVTGAFLAALPWSRQRSPLHFRAAAGMAVAAMVLNLVLSIVWWTSPMAAVPDATDPELLTKLLRSSKVVFLTSAMVCLPLLAITGIVLDVLEVVFATTVLASQAFSSVIPIACSILDITDDDDRDAARAGVACFFIGTTGVLAACGIYLQAKFQDVSAGEGGLAGTAADGAKSRIVNFIAFCVGTPFILVGAGLLWQNADGLAYDDPDGTTSADNRSSIVAEVFVFVFVAVAAGGAHFASYQKKSGLTTFFVLAAASLIMGAPMSPFQFGWSTVNIYRVAQADNVNVEYESNSMLHTTEDVSKGQVLAGDILCFMGVFLCLGSIMLKPDDAGAFSIPIHLPAIIAVACTVAAASVAATSDAAEINADTLIGFKVGQFAGEGPYETFGKYVATPLIFGLVVIIGSLLYVPELIITVVVLACTKGLTTLESGFSIADEIEENVLVGGRAATLTAMSLFYIAVILMFLTAHSFLRAMDGK